MRRFVLVFGLCLANLVACETFVVARRPATVLLEEREAARRTRVIAVSSADPYMLIAERPLRSWNEWHGGEATWVKVVEVLNWPALMAAKHVGDELSSDETVRGRTWRRAWIYLAVSSVQWLGVGVILDGFARRRMRKTHCNSPAHA